MYTSVHLNVSRESYSFELFDLKLELLVESCIFIVKHKILLIVGFRMLLCLRLCIFIIKDKTFDYGNPNIH